MGQHVIVTDEEAAILQLAASILSVVTCAIVVISIQLDTRNSRKSYHLRLVQRLLLSDIGLSTCVIFYFIMQIVLPLEDLHILCKLYLPLADYFFLVSYGWTVMLAFRFRDSFKDKKITGIPKTLWKVWAIPAVFALIVLITAFASDKAVEVEPSDAHTNRSCTYNHNTATGIALDLVTFQGPLLITIIVNCVTYMNGLKVLSNTPQSVIARQMRKAGGYLGVLCVIWVPNMIYNFLSMFAGRDEQYNAFLDLVIFLSAIQGFLNVCVYVWSDPQMKQWFCKHLFFFIPFRPADPSDKDDNRYNTNDNSNSNSRHYNHDEEEGEDDPHIDPADSQWLGDSTLHDNLLHGNNNNGEDGDSSIQSKQSLRASRNSFGNASNASSINSQHKTKSILIAASNAKAIESKNKNKTYLASSADLDHERFVRFGENQVKVMASSLASSTGIGTPRSSELMEQETNAALDQKIGSL